MTITYRKITKEDIPVLTPLVGEGWDLKALIDEDCINLYSEEYITFSMSNSSFGYVAVIDNEAVGCIMARVESQYKRDEELSHRDADLRKGLAKSEATSKYINTLDGLFEVENELIRKCGLQPDGDVVLFVVKRSMRGKGVGKKLFSMTVEEFAQQGVRSYSLVTDTSCSYAVYDRMGLVRKAQTSYLFRSKQDVEVTVFLYYQDIQNETRGKVSK